MPDGDRKEELALWIEKAAWRRSECMADIRRLTGDENRGRKRKLLARADRYEALLEVLEAQKGTDGKEKLRRLEEDEYQALESELSAVKERILSSAGNILDGRARLKEIRTRWGKLADEIMKEREGRGLPRGRVEPLDYSFPPPPPGAPPELRELHSLIRELGI